ncbi:MAG: cysteine--tRNA ligase [Lysobacterales bacterium]|nr:MAG: cysteine--tRNA ligase [Xanthomonadales bacterium]
MLQIQNSLTGRKEAFQPIRPGEVRMYVCGITVYDYCHLGHARMLVVFDVVRRHLEASGYRVTFVRNITDIDDKIIQRANENGETMGALTERFIRAYHEDCAALGVRLGDHEPRATEFVPQIVEMIRTLVDKGYAYVGPNRDVYYAVAKFEPYGQLSGKRLADLRAGARIEVDESKRDPLDFVLWKAAKPGEPAWDSPWGPGRPGWHIECSAMSVELLGDHFDIHGGGMDLKFPHHENEIAQTCAACGSKFVNTWMHNGFVRVDEEKMSKSLGNFFTVREVLGWVRDPEVVRYFMLGSHYRGPINYSDESLAQADAALMRLYSALRGVEPAARHVETDATRRFVAAMDDDFNTPVAIAELQNLARELNTAKAAGQGEIASARAAELRALGARLGLLGVEVEEFLRKQGSRPTALTDADVERLLDERAAARKAKNFKESDRIRDVLVEAGIVIEDQPGGRTLWRR